LPREPARLSAADMTTRRPDRVEAVTVDAPATEPAVSAVPATLQSARLNPELRFEANSASLPASASTPRARARAMPRSLPRALPARENQVELLNPY